MHLLRGRVICGRVAPKENPGIVLMASPHNERVAAVTKGLAVLCGSDFQVSSKESLPERPRRHTVQTAAQLLRRGAVFRPRWN